MSGGPEARTVAHVDLRPTDGGSETPDPSSRRSAEWSAVLDGAIRAIEHTVRPDDRVCPYGVSRIAIAFGPDADAVRPVVLGERLARAIGTGLVGAGPDPSGHPAATSAHPAGIVAVNRTDNGSRRADAIPTTTVVTIERQLHGLGPGPTGGPLVPLALRPAPWGGSTPPLRHRTVIRYSTRRLAGYGTRHDDHRARGNQALGAVLVVDPHATAAGSPGLAALATTTLAERLGYRAGVVSLADEAGVVTEIDGVGIDLVILMVPAEPAGAHSSWASSTWSLPAQLVGAYRSVGIDVLAVGAGAGAGALAGCLEKGAHVLFDLDALPAELLALSRSGTLGTERVIGRHSAHLPPSLEALLLLTSSERRVLYYLTAGRSAQEIADELVVSLATVRSHIRSVLRKLGVRSQLAAVAVANSRGPALAEPARAS
jgi:DNA-binding CsgD family transcriptional regulator